MAENNDDVCEVCSIINVVGGAIIVTCSLIAFLLHQTLYTPAPRCYLQELYVPALDLSAAPPPENITNPFVFFDLSLYNYMTTSYDYIGLTFYYGHKAVGKYAVPAFDRGSKKTTQRRDVVETRGVPWEDAVGAVSSGSTAAFRVEMAMQVRFRILFWYSKETELTTAADVAVGAAGLKAVEDDIRLNSAAPERRIRVFLVFLTLFVIKCLLF